MHLSYSSEIWQTEPTFNGEDDNHIEHTVKVHHVYYDNNWAFPVLKIYACLCFRSKNFYVSN